MKANVAARAVILIFLSLFLSCGELETLLPSNGTYQVKTLINGNSLESCSLIRSDDKIRPYFVVSVEDDPDLIGLLVYFENPQGEVIGEKVRYILWSHAEEAIPAENEEEAPPDNTNDTALEETDTIDIDEEENEAEGRKAWEIPEHGAVKEKWSFTDTKPVVKNTGVEIAVRSLSDELPYLPLPQALEIGSYTLVFEAIGVKETLSRIQTSIFYLGSAEFNLKDISMYLPGQSGSQLIPPGTTVMLETRLDFDSRLDPYVIWYNGRHIISEGKISGGAGTILWKASEQTGFYTLRLEVFPFQFKRHNYAGVSREITLPVSPKSINLGYFFENNRGYTARSPLAAGTAYPEQVRLMTLNSTEDTDNPEKESMPVESLAPPIPPELLQWYQFGGNLHNSTSPLTDVQSLSPVAEKAPRWAAAGQSYGLSIGLDEAYSLSPINFFRKENDQGGGVLLFHIMPATEGAIFSAFFPFQSSLTDGVWMDMVRKSNTVTLRLSAEGAIIEMPVYLIFSEPQGLIPIVVEFYIRPYRLEAKLSLSEEYSLENKVEHIKFPVALSGEGRIRLGGNIDKSMINNTAETKPTIQPFVQSAPLLTEPLFEETLAAMTTITDNAEKDTSITASETLSQTVNQDTIWDEFAILFSAIPLLPEELLAPVAVEELNINKTETAEPKSESHVPAVKNEAADADNKPAINPEPSISAGLTSMDKTPLQEKIPIPDTGETESNETEGDENLVFPAASVDDTIQEIIPPPPVESRPIASN